MPKNKPVVRSRDGRVRRQAKLDQEREEAYKKAVRDQIYGPNTANIISGLGDQ